MTTPELPFERSYWADPGKLMAGYYPPARQTRQRPKPSSKHCWIAVFGMWST